jgi:pilus assembly protein FimV
MFGKALLRAVVGGLLAVPSAAWALGLGDIRLNSGLNAPLDAEIELIGVTQEELATLSANLAARDTFARYGLEWPAFLASVQLSTQKVGGRDVLKVKSAEAITEPFVTLLVEVNWARGRLVREYTVLLDPPVYAPTQQPPAPVVAATAAAGERTGEIARAPESGTAFSPQPQAQPAAGESTYTVRRGDTLSGIASGVGGDRRQTMTAIYRANPDAFGADMNELRAGAILRVPPAEEVAAIDPAEAAAEVRRQLGAWRARSGADAAGRLRLVTPSEPAGEGEAAGAGGGAEAQGLRDRVRQLEGELADSRRLLELRNAELADLQARLRANQTAPAGASTEDAGALAGATPEGAAPSESPIDETTTAPADAAAVAEAAPPPEAAPPEQAQPQAEQPARRPAEEPVVAASEESGGSMSFLASLWWVPLLLLAVGGGFFGYRKFRERQKMEFDDRLGELTAATSETDLRQFASPDTAKLRQPIAPAEETFLVEESGAHERPRFAEPGKAAPKPTKTVSADETISSETAINLDQGDPLAEADFHMAYGLYDQAADLVRIAIARDPSRRDLKLKLLEVFFVWGNREQFLQTARELAESRAEAPAGEWEKVVIMGKQLAPDDALFSQGGVSGAAAGGVDLNLEGGQNRVDFDLFGADTGSDSSAATREGVGLQFDSGLDADLGDKDPTGEAQAIKPEGVDFLLDAPELGTDRSGATTTRQITAQMPAAPTVQLPDLASADPNEAPTVEQPALRTGDNHTIRQKVEMARRQAGAHEQTAELALDDLGLDVDALEKGAQTSVPGQDAPTMVAGFDERSRRMMEEAEQRAQQGGASASSPSESGTWFINEGDLDGDLDAQKEAAGLTAQLRALDANGAADAAQTSRLDALKSSEIDLDLGGQAAHHAGANGSGVDLDVGSPTLLSDGPFTSTQKVAQEALALPELEPVTMSEVGTKLDLARAYMDMGDPEGARNILEEVMQEGSVSQKQEAQRLIDSLPG